MLTIYTDGACSVNPGPGGYAAIILSADGKERIISGREESTTNNRMELLAVIKALESIYTSEEILLYTDSKYVCDAINYGWAKNWKEHNWMRSGNKQAKNIDLWEELLILLDNHNVSVEWIKGHAATEYNNRCDKIAVQESKKQFN